jgi:gluconokinase
MRSIAGGRRRGGPETHRWRARREWLILSARGSRLPSRPSGGISLLADTHRDLYVVMGVAGSGKTRIGAAFARALGVPFVEGDDFHPAANVDRMSRGIALTDEDRAGWLDALALRIGEASEFGTGLVMTCSALKRSYRDVLRAGAPRGKLTFVFLRGPHDLIAERLAARRGHFMSPALLDSQFATLEEPGLDEAAWVAEVSATPAEIVASLVARATA